MSAFLVIKIMAITYYLPQNFGKTDIPNGESPTQISKFHILFNLKFLPPSRGRAGVGANFN
jgi:hypothetical protein